MLGVEEKSSFWSGWGCVRLCNHSTVLPTALTALQLHQGILVNAHDAQAYLLEMAAGSFLSHLCAMALSWAQK